MDNERKKEKERKKRNMYLKCKFLCPHCPFIQKTYLGEGRGGLV